MSTYAAPVDVKIDAMIESGITPISAETDPGWKTTVANARYEPVMEDVLARHAWKCATATTPITFQEERSYGIWRYAYFEPSPDPKKIINRGVYLANPMADWGSLTRARQIPHDINNGVILTNYKPTSSEGAGVGLVLLYGFRAQEGDWTPRLAAAIVRKLSGVFAGAIKKDQVLARRLDHEAEDLIMKAAATDAEQASRRSSADDILVDAHRWGYPGMRAR